MTLGTVTTVSPLTVLLDGSSTSAPSGRLSSASLTVNARVVVAPLGGGLMVLGVVA